MALAIKDGLFCCCMYLPLLDVFGEGRRNEVNGRNMLELGGGGVSSAR